MTREEIVRISNLLYFGEIKDNDIIYLLREYHQDKGKTYNENILDFLRVSGLLNTVLVSILSYYGTRFNICKLWTGDPLKDKYCELIKIF